MCGEPWCSAVGAVRLDIPALGCSYYTSNLHKWMCTPKGAAFLWAERSRQRGLVPTVSSHGYGLVRSRAPPPLCTATGQLAMRLRLLRPPALPCWLTD